MSIKNDRWIIEQAQRLRLLIADSVEEFTERTKPEASNVSGVSTRATTSTSSPETVLCSVSFFGCAPREQDAQHQRDRGQHAERRGQQRAEGGPLAGRERLDRIVADQLQELGEAVPALVPGGPERGTVGRTTRLALIVKPEDV